MRTYLLKIAPIRAKQGQIKMFESIAMLLVFFFLIAIGLRFYGGLAINDLEATKFKFQTFDSIKMAITIASLPEVKCSIQNVQGGSCVDLVKVMAWNQSKEFEPAKSYYFDLLGFSTIYLEQLEPTRLNFTMHDLVPPGNYSTSQTPLPVSIWDPISRTSGFGILYVRSHAQE